MDQGENKLAIKRGVGYWESRGHSRSPQLKYGLESGVWTDGTRLDYPTNSTCTRSGIRPASMPAVQQQLDGLRGRGVRSPPSIG